MVVLVESMNTYIRDQGNSVPRNSIKQLQTLQRYHKTGIGFTKAHLSTNSYQFRLSFGIVRIRTVNQMMKLKGSDKPWAEARKKSLHKRVTATFIPSFRSFATLECSFTRGQSPWNATFRTLNVRPEWSRIFKYCTLGDIGGVQRLIEQGLATSNDVDQEGLTALHVSASISWVSSTAN